MVAKESSKSRASEEEECMQAWSPRSEIQRDALICFCLQLFSETCTKLQKAETPPRETCGRVANHFWSLQTPADHFWLLKNQKSGQPASFSGWPASCCCWTAICCNREQERAWQCICKICVHNHPPYHVMNSRECGSRPSGTNRAFLCMMAERRSCTIQCKMNAQVNT